MIQERHSRSRRPAVDLSDSTVGVCKVSMVLVVDSRNDVVTCSRHNTRPDRSDRVAVEVVVVVAEDSSNRVHDEAEEEEVAADEDSTEDC